MINLIKMYHKLQMIVYQIKAKPLNHVIFLNKIKMIMIMITIVSQLTRMILKQTVMMVINLIMQIILIQCYLMKLKMELLKKN